ncbi:uncharacterized protein [Temnothorax longispinosus]|uniref:uncharacterized protein n=1 Tax=Temnothorax longispinosus TaxID=300112 RepID=UPI003A99D462
MHVHFGMSTITRYSDDRPATFSPRWMIDVPGTGQLYIQSIHHQQMKLIRETSGLLPAGEHYYNRCTNKRVHQQNFAVVGTVREAVAARRRQPLVERHAGGSRNGSHFKDVFYLRCLFGLQPHEEFYKEPGPEDWN